MNMFHSGRPLAHTCSCMLQVSKTYDSFIELPTEFDNALNEKGYDNAFMRNKVLNCTHHKTAMREKQIRWYVSSKPLKTIYCKSTQYA